MAETITREDQAEHEPEDAAARLAAAECFILANSLGYEDSLHDPVELIKLVEDNIVNEVALAEFDGALLDVAEARGANPDQIAELRTALQSVIEADAALNASQRMAV